MRTPELEGQPTYEGKDELSFWKKRDKHIHIHLCKTYEIPVKKKKNIYIYIHTDLTSTKSSR